MAATPRRRPFNSSTRPKLPHALLPLQIEQPLDCPSQLASESRWTKRLWRQTFWTCASQTARFLVWASTHVLSMFSGSEKGVISLSHFLKCFQVSSCRDKSHACSLKTTEEEKTLSGIQECMLSVFKNKPKLDQGRGLNLAGIMSSFTFSDRQRGLWGLCWL